MRFVSTRNEKKQVSFQQALLNCMPEDGGLYVPCDCEDLRHWILYADEKTSFANLAGTLTSALINTEFSPIICEAIATSAFPFEPVVRQLDENLFILELYHGFSGTFKDFGTAYLASALETILKMNGEKSILLDATTGELGACMSKALKGKKLLKSILIAPKGSFRGLDESDFVWNGGSIFPIEVDGSEKDCHDFVQHFFSNPELIKKYHLSLANTANIGRLLPQAFFYTFAFTRIKKIVNGDIYYAMSAGNYGNLISGLYSWQLALPVKGFILPSTPQLCADAQGKVMVVNDLVPLEKRNPANPSDPLNIERLEHFFKQNSLMMRSFVYPANVSNEQISEACKELFVKYKIYADSETSAAYAAARLRTDITRNDEGSVVLVARNCPFIDREFLMHNLGECPKLPEKVEGAFKPVALNRPVVSPKNYDYLTSVLNSLNLRRIF